MLAPADTEPRVLAEIHDYAELHAALRARADQLEVSRQWLDKHSGLQNGYCGKLLSPTRIKNIGAQSLGPLLTVLGLRILLAEDPASMARMASRLEKRDQRAVRQLTVGKPKKRVYPKLGSAWGKYMAARRILSQSPKRRSQIARIAGVSRWLKWRDIKEAARGAAKPISMTKDARAARLRLDQR
jgi:hypothetical protein